MFLPVVVELNLLGVADAGKPNFERIMLRPNDHVRLAQFGIVIGVSTPSGEAQLLRDQTFWLPDVVISPPSWILLYTGPGKDEWGTWNGQPVLALHWAKQQTVFNNPSLVPVIVRVDAAKVGPGKV